MQNLSSGLLISAAIICAISAQPSPAWENHYFHTYSPELPDTSAATVRLDSVSVVSARVPVTLAKSARLVTVLDSATLASLPVVSVNDILKYSAGVDVRQRGDMGAQTDISVRGGSYDQIAVFLDGINICDPQTGHNAMDLPVDINDIERIEILSGPAGTVYGSSSLLGAVNIVTKKAASNSVSAHVEGGSYGYFNGGVCAGIVSGRVSNRISASYLRSDGSSRSLSGGLNADYEAVKAFYQGSYRHSDFDLDWHAGLSSRNFGSNTFYSPKFDDQFEHTFKSFFALQARTHGFIKFNPSVYWNRSQDRFELFRGNSAAVPFNHHRTSVWGVNLNAWFETIIGKTAFGAEMRNEDIISTNLGEWLKVPVAVPHSDTSYVKGLNRTNISLFLEHSVEFGGFTASAGVAAMKNTGNEDDFRFYPSVNMSMRFAGNWKAYISYNSSLRMPTFTELYYSVGGHLADKNLKAERMQSAEAGMRYANSWISATASVYYNHGTNMIDWIKDEADGPDALWKSVNFTKVNTIGEEFSLRMDFRRLLMREEFFLRTLDLSYSHICQNRAETEGIQSMLTLEYLRNKFVAMAGIHVWKGLNLDISWRWVDRKGDYERYENLSSTGEVVPYSPYNVLDTRLSWTGSLCRSKDDSRRYTVWMEANNILDHSYFDYGNIPQPGIVLKAGISVNLGF